MSKKQMTGAKMVVEALKDQGVEVVFGYPGGAVLPIYDEIFQQNRIRHVLVRHEQGAVHAAEGYARSTGKPGVVLVTSGPGATNAVTGLTDALLELDPDRRSDGPGAHLHDRHRRLSRGRHRRHHPPLHKAQLAGERDRPPGARAARGVPRRRVGSSRTGARRYPEGRPVRDRHLCRAEGHQDLALRAPHQGRCGHDPRACRGHRKREATCLLYRRRRHQLRPQGLAPSARAGRHDGFPDHLDVDGPRRLSGQRQRLARDAGDARSLRGQPRDARLRPDDQRRRPVRRPHHRPHPGLLAPTPSRRTSTSTRRRSTRSSTSRCPSSATWPLCWKTCWRSGKNAARA